jgi:hypothetical protein
MAIGIGAQIIGASSWREDVPQNLLGTDSLFGRVTTPENKSDDYHIDMCVQLSRQQLIDEKPD